jgi:predicted RND superfamily exporter protein
MTPPDRSLAARLTDSLIRNRLVLLFGAIVLTAIAWVPASRLRFDQSIESLFAHNDPHLQAYSRSKALFGGDEVAFLAYQDPELYSNVSQQRIRTIADKLADVPGVVEGSVQNLATSLLLARAAAVPESKIKDLFRGVLVGEDDQTTAIVFRFAPQQSAPVPRAETIRRIREIANGNELKTYVVGEPVSVYDMFRYVEEDGFWLWVYSSALLLFVILVLFRSLRWTLLPMLVVLAAVIWTRALLVVSQMQLSMVSSMLNSLVTIIGVATAIHIAVQYRERRGRMEPEPALRDALIELLPAIFWTCATTAAGFLVLISSAIAPVRSFGIMMGIGSMVVLPAVMWIMPGGVLVGRASSDVGRAPGEGWLGRRLLQITDSVERRPLVVWLITGVFVAFALLGMTRLHVETDFSKNFRESSPILQGLDFAETHLGGAGTWEVNFPAPHELTEEYLEQVRELSSQLKQLERGDRRQLTKVLSLADGIDAVPSRILFVNLSLSRRLDLLRRIQPEFERSLYNAKAGRMRIMLRALEREPSEDKLQLIADVEARAREQFGEAEATGLYVLLTFIIESLLHDQWVTFALATAAIWGLMAIAFRSVWIGLISLVPNVFPIIVVVGAMGWGGLPINIATAMISCVSMGMTVDSSIHYLAGFNAARRDGAPFFEALRQTHSGVGRALVFANVALIAGFLVLTISHFIPLVYFGLLVAVAMLGGLIGNLILLPLLLRIGHQRD